MVSKRLTVFTMFFFNYKASFLVLLLSLSDTDNISCDFSAMRNCITLPSFYAAALLQAYAYFYPERTYLCLSDINIQLSSFSYWLVSSVCLLKMKLQAWLLVQLLFRIPGEKKWKKNESAGSLSIVFQFSFIIAAFTGDIFDDTISTLPVWSCLLLWRISCLYMPAMVLHHPQ